MNALVKRIPIITLIMIMAAAPAGVAAIGQGQQKTAAERSAVGNIIHFFLNR